MEESNDIKIIPLIFTTHSCQQFSIECFEMLWLYITTPPYNLTCKLSCMAEWLYISIPSYLLTILIFTARRMNGLFKVLYDNCNCKFKFKIVCKLTN